MFTVTASSGTTMTYQWTKNTLNIPGATNSIYTILSVLPTDAGIYAVRITNAAGTTISSNAALIVLTPPTIMIQPQSQTVTQGQTLSLSVAASGTAPLSYRWFLNNNPVPSAWSSTLTISNPQNADMGGYYVVVSNSYGVVTSSVASATLQAWVATVPAGSSSDNLAATALDSAGNIVAAGNATVNGRQDFVVWKYDAAGNLLWKTNYDDTGKQLVTGLAIDSSDNIYVTGSSQYDGSHGGWNYLTVKFDARGSQLWAANLNGSNNGDDYGNAIAVDAAGNAIVTGQSPGLGGHNQFGTVKYDTNGNQLWVRTYTGPGAIEDDGLAVAVDGSGNIYVTGQSKGMGSDFDYATIKYAPDGAQVWVSRYNGPGNAADQPSAITIGPDQNVYVTGASKGSGSDFDYATIKYASDGTQVWVARYNGPSNKVDKAAALVLDSSTNIFVTGSSEVTSGHSEYATIKYNSAGVQLWAQRYNWPGGDDDDGVAIALDPAGDAYVTGKSKGGGTGYDFATIKYSSADGTQIWTNRFNSSGGANDYPVGVLVDSHYNAYVVGQSANIDCIVIKYQSGIFAPGILSPPQSCRSAVGQSVTFSVMATGTDPLRYQWVFDGNIIPGATNSVLNLTGINSTNAGHYAVRVSNSAGYVVSSPAALNILTVAYEQPVLSFDGSSGIAPAGFTFQYSAGAGAVCVIQATTDLYHWTSLATNTATDATMTFTDTGASNFPSRLYRVVIKQ
jgi:uncharacterized delta-60 repeat protein